MNDSGIRLDNMQSSYDKGLSTADGRPQDHLGATARSCVGHRSGWLSEREPSNTSDTIGSYPEP